MFVVHEWVMRVLDADTLTLRLWTKHERESSSRLFVGEMA